jgi:hypothetical protein
MCCKEENLTNITSKKNTRKADGAEIRETVSSHFQSQRPSVLYLSNYLGKGLGT